MSVNEVKLVKAKDAFVVRGSGPASSRTFCIGDEDHTLGNSLRHVLVENPSVGFAGYSVPHPSEPVVQIRVQTITTSPAAAAHDDDEETLELPPTAIDTLKVACQTLSSQCDIVLEKLEDLIPEVRDDRLIMERRILEEEEEQQQQQVADDDDDDEEDEVEEDGGRGRGGR